MLDIKVDQYDFLDFGSSRGGYIDFVKKRLLYSRELGIDKNPKKVEKLARQGYNVACADLLTVGIPEACVKAVTIGHMLEHLPTMTDVHYVIRKALHAAQRFVIIEGPWFESDEYLASLGLKCCWSDWSVHRTHVKIADVLSCLKDVTHYVMADEEITTSAHPHIVPLSAPKNLLCHRDEDKKKEITLQGVHSNFVVYIFKRGNHTQHEKIVGSRSNFTPWK